MRIRVRGAASEFMQIEFPQQHGARLLQLRPNRAVEVWDKLGEYFRAAGGTNPFGVAEIFQGQRDAMKGTAPSACCNFLLRFFGRCPRQLRSDSDVGAQPRFRRFDPV